jgi:hypothetical protein
MRSNTWPAARPAVVSVTEGVTTEDLRRMHEAGVRGVRFAFFAAHRQRNNAC